MAAIVIVTGLWDPLSIVEKLKVLSKPTTTVKSDTGVVKLGATGSSNSQFVVYTVLFPAELLRVIVIVPVCAVECEPL